MCRPARRSLHVHQHPAAAKIEIEKQTEPAAGSGFGFTGSANLPDADESFSLDDDGIKTISNLVPGSYQVDEDAKAGWDLTQIDCTDPDGGTTTSLANRHAAIDLDPGETVHCTFTQPPAGEADRREADQPGRRPGNFTFTGTAAGTISDNGRSRSRT